MKKINGGATVNNGKKVPFISVNSSNRSTGSIQNHRRLGNPDNIADLVVPLDTAVYEIAVLLGSFGGDFSGKGHGVAGSKRSDRLE